MWSTVSSFFVLFNKILKFCIVHFFPECYFILANSELLDWPIVYANDGFCYIAGLSRSEMLAQSCVCEFMHGHETDENTVEKFRHDLSNKQRTQIEIVLYNRNGKMAKILLWLSLRRNDKKRLSTEMYK